jgi:hypothetical protein
MGISPSVIITTAVYSRLLVPKIPKRSFSYFTAKEGLLPMEESYQLPPSVSPMRHNTPQKIAQLISLLEEAVHEARDWERFYRFIGQADKAALYEDLAQMRSDYLREVRKRIPGVNRVSRGSSAPYS